MSFFSVLKNMLSARGKALALYKRAMQKAELTSGQSLDNTNSFHENAACTVRQAITPEGSETRERLPLLLAIIGVVLICVSDTIGDKQTPHLLIRSTMPAIIFVVLYIFLVPAIQTAYSELSEKRPINDSRPLVCPPLIPHRHRA